MTVTLAQIAPAGAKTSETGAGSGRRGCKSQLVTRKGHGAINNKLVRKVNGPTAVPATHGGPNQSID
jgi:hypothetical protein